MTNFNSDHIAFLEGMQVQINLKGPEAKSGLLLSVKNDHLVLQTENEVIYYNLDHVKSVTKNTKLNSNSSLDLKEAFVNGDSFEDVLASMPYKWVKINRGGPEHVEGVLSKFKDDQIILIKDRELIHLSLFHIKSVSTGTINNKQSEKES